MKFIQLGWQTSRSGRLTRVVRNREIRVPNYRLLNPMQRERFEILKILSKKRKEQIKQQKKDIQKSQIKVETKFKQQEKKKEHKAFCSTCKLIKVLKNTTFNVTPNGMLYVRGECNICNKKNTRMLRKATAEELKAIGK